MCVRDLLFTVIVRPQSYPWPRCSFRELCRRPYPAETWRTRFPSSQGSASVQGPPHQGSCPLTMVTCNAQKIQVLLLVVFQRMCVGALVGGSQRKTPPHDPAGSPPKPSHRRVWYKVNVCGCGGKTLLALLRHRWREEPTNESASTFVTKCFRQQVQEHKSTILDSAFATRGLGVELA